MQLDDEQLRRIKERLPSGYDIAELRVLETQAMILPERNPDAEEQAIIAALGGPPMINRREKPTVLRIVKWMCHAGVPNLNRQQFVAEELQAIAPDLFREPNFGVMDWDHGAVRQSENAPPCIGVWYKADWAYDTKANAWGLLVSGVQFAWLFPEIADALILEQTREGVIKGSMACIPRSIEMIPQGDDSVAILHNPVFFTHSLLSRMPADPAATGKVTEDPDREMQDLMDELMNNAATADVVNGTTTTLTTGGTSATPIWISTPSTTGGSLNTDTITIPFVQTTPNLELLVADAVQRELESQRAAQEQSEMTETLETLEAANVALQAEIEALKAKVTAMETPADSKCETCGNSCQCAKVTELETVRDALKTECDTAMARVAELEQTLAATQEKLNGYEVKAAEVAAAQRLVDRLAQLPEAYREAHAKRDAEKRTQLEAVWMQLSDEEWALRLDELSVVLPMQKASFVERSRQAGPLPSGESMDIRAKLATHIM